MKQFKGFTPQQQFVLLQKMGYSGPMDQTEMSNYIQSNPSAQARLGRYADLARKRVEKLNQPAVQEKPQFATGGFVPPEQFNQEAYAQKYDVGKMNPYIHYMTYNRDKPIGELWDTPESQASGTTETPQVSPVIQQSQETTKQALETPEQIVTPANVQKIATNSNQFIKEGTGQAGEAPTVEASVVTKQMDEQLAATPEKFDAATYDATKVGDAVKEATEGLEAATADPSEKATVRGQLEMLMQDFEGGETPPWASGAMREAMGIMQRRGLGASSMAGQAVVQAAMESAIGIASQDAATFAQFEMQNLNNRQQTAIFKTQQTIAGMFTDQAAENAAKQFNAASENQVNQFFADLESTVARFNADQINSVMMFNAGQKNAIKQFNSQLQAQREEFNAKNDLIIAQANTKWRQDIATMDTATQNEANMEFAKTANGLTARALDHIWQKERDIMSFAFAASESALDRAHALLIGDKQIAAEEKAAQGYLFMNILDGIGIF